MSVGGSAREGDPVAVVAAVAALIVVVVGAGLVVMQVRSRLLRKQDDRSSTESWLDELRAMHRRGEVSDEEFQSARTSLSYAVVAMLIAVVVGGLAACAIAYARRGGDAVDSAFTLPLGTSAVTVGFGLLITFASAPFDLRGSWIIVPIGQALVAVPLVVRLVLPVLRSVDPRLREAAASLGSSPARTWRTVDLPVLGRALAVGAGFAAAVSLGEFGATSFLARTSAPTLPVEIAHLMSRPGQASVGQAAALSVVLVVLTGAVVALVERWRQPGGGAL